MKNKYMKITVFKETDDDWYPSILLKDCTKKLVRISFLKLQNGEYRVCAWGDDDFVMEIDFPKPDKHNAKALFYSVISTEKVSIEMLRKSGFKQA